MYNKCVTIKQKTSVKANGRKDDDLSNSGQEWYLVGKHCTRADHAVCTGEQVNASGTAVNVEWIQQLNR